MKEEKYTSGQNLFNKTQWFQKKNKEITKGHYFCLQTQRKYVYLVMNWLVYLI